MIFLIKLCPWPNVNKKSSMDSLSSPFFFAQSIRPSCYEVGPMRDSLCLTSLPTPIHKGDCRPIFGLGHGNGHDLGHFKIEKPWNVETSKMFRMGFYIVENIPTPCGSMFNMFGGSFRISWNVVNVSYIKYCHETPTLTASRFALVFHIKYCLS